MRIQVSCEFDRSMDDIETVWLELEVKQMRFHRRVAVTDEFGWGVSATDFFAKLKIELAKAHLLAKITEIIHYRLRAGSPPLSVDSGDGYIQIVKPLTESQNPLPNLYVLLGVERTIDGDSDSDDDSVEIVDSKTTPRTPALKLKTPPIRFRGVSTGGVDGPHFAQMPSGNRGAKRSVATTSDSFALTAPSPVFGTMSVGSPVSAASPVSTRSIVSEPVTEKAMRAADRKKRYKPNPPPASSFASSTTPPPAPKPADAHPLAAVVSSPAPAPAQAQAPPPLPSTTLKPVAISISVPAFPIPTLPVSSIAEADLDTILAQLEREDSLLEERIRDAEANIRRKKAERVAALQLSISDKRARLSQLLESNL